MTTINVDPSTLTKKQQTFMAEYNALQQLRTASEKEANALAGIANRTVAQNKALDVENFNLLEAERQIITFMSDRQTALDNEIRLLTLRLNDTPASQLYLRQTLSGWISQYNETRNDLLGLPITIDIPLPRQLPIGDMIYDNMGSLRWNTNTLSGWAQSTIIETFGAAYNAVTTFFQYRKSTNTHYANY